MSRHRDFRNRQYSYDYDDNYYDDDYYDEEEDDEYYQEQERLRREREGAESAFIMPTVPEKNLIQKKLVESTLSMSSPQAPKAPPPGFGVPSKANESDAITLVNMGLGFSTVQCREALLMFDNSLDRAMDYLISQQYGTKDTSSQNQNQSPSNDTKVNDKISGVKSKYNGPISLSLSLKKKDEIIVKSLTPPSMKAPKDNVSKPSKNFASELKSKRDVASTEFKPASILTERSRLSMVVLGHVDAGKSTLMGQLLLKLGHVDKRVITKFQKQATEIGKSSFALAWVFDTDESERSRGVTMDVGTRLAKTNSHDIVILDAPGHKDFIPAMIHGAASADVGLLVVSAATGEFEAGFNTSSSSNGHGQGASFNEVGQTREHVVLARGLGVSQLLIVINKLDSTIPAWSESRYKHIQQTILPFILRSGFNTKRVRFVPVSGLSGKNVDANDKSLAWFKGPTLIEAIDSFQPAQRNVNMPLRIITTDTFTEGKGVTCSGRIVQGKAKVGDVIKVLPLGDKATIQSINHGSVYAGRSLGSIVNSTDDKGDMAIAGDSVDILLSGIDIARISPGSVLTHENQTVPLSKKILAQIVVMDNLNVPIINGTQVSLHMNSVDIPANISKLISIVGSNNATKLRRITGGNNATVEIKLSEKLCVETFSDCRSLGRFVLRRGGDTIAIGIVEKCY